MGLDSRKNPSTNNVHAPSELRPAAPGGSVLEQLRALRVQLLKTIVFALAAVAVIGVFSIAWFASNDRVQSETTPISAGFEALRLATTGQRQTAEETLLHLEQGTAFPYNDKTYYYTESGAIALRLSEDYVVSPGASGSVTFYIIPTRDGAATVTLHLGLTGYVKGADNTAEPVDDPALNALLSGHILLFGSQTDGHYSHWLFHSGNTGEPDNVITVTLPEDARKDVPFPVTLYWIWPLRYENMVQDLYAEGSEEFARVFAPFVEEQADTAAMTAIDGTGYRHSRIFLTQGALQTAADRTKAYNLADEYIGTNANYLYLTIQTSATDGESGKEQS